MAIANNPVAVKLNAFPGENDPNNDSSGAGSYLISPDSRRVAFGYPPAGGVCCGEDLYTTSITGGTPTGPFATGARDDFYYPGLTFSTDGRRVIYVRFFYDEFGNYLSSSIWAANIPQ